MPGFQVHITGSAIVGAGYGAAAWYFGQLPPLTCLLAGGLCTAAGALPDLDSGSGVPLRESVAFAAAVVPLLLIHRFQQMGMPLEAIILAGAALYFIIRFGLSWLLEHFSRHRGMFHSLPAAAIAGQVTFLMFGAEEPLRRYLVSGAVVLGFLTHLILDEIWSVRLGLFGPKVKKSFGTAMKFHGSETWSNVVTYALVLILGLLAAGDAASAERMARVRQQFGQSAVRGYPSAPTAYRR